MVFAFLAFLALVTIHASATPTPPALSLSNLTAAIFKFDASIRCNDKTSEQRLILTDCKAAVAHLPQDEPGDVYFSPHAQQYVYPKFSRTPTEERHRLPVNVEHGSCKVEVRLASAATADYSSWRIIALRVGNVIQKCVKVQLGAGGWTVTGEDKDIEILVYSASKDSSNGTLVMGNGMIS